MRLAISALLGFSLASGTPYPDSGAVIEPPGGTLDLCAGRICGEFPPLPASVRDLVPGAEDLSASPRAYDLTSLGEETMISGVYVIGSVDLLFEEVAIDECESNEDDQTPYVSQRFVIVDQHAAEGSLSQVCAKLTLRYSSGLRGGLDVLKALDTRFYIQTKPSLDRGETYERDPGETVLNFDREYFE
ncbi:hypothetical protein [Erythrobacter sp. JK5]|uniref:hypothetical protein n=1 Tax=Erythrobacter sp. JK5 TaxID=2829500 RepID=UPI001BAA3270|nr:hypothetical protein [Erythrobacter sp. JK5]QUL37060.1 hypothetical protein KDC96_11740 [Erythrobacter sp. JK5]